jgi:hypothetical protein
MATATTKGAGRLTLDPDKLVTTLERLERRIEERFPAAGLAGVARALTGLARRAGRDARRLARPYWLLRLAALVIVVGVAVALVNVAGLAEWRAGAHDAVDLVQAIEAAMNIMLVGGAAVFSLMTIEGRMRRARALAAVHRFRALVHVIDMHQLTKDPQTAAVSGPTTATSPDRTLTPFELTRYLDYCSEMLALAAKVAALYAIASPDPAVATAVNEIEQLASGLSAKIWQKIMIIHAAAGADD